jgi:hypothetical protein
MSDFWINQPKNLWEFKFHNPGQTLNSLSALTIIITIVLALMCQNIKPFYIGVSFIAILGVIFYLGYANNGEGFQAFNSLFAKNEPFAQASNKPHPIPGLGHRGPTPNNPFMNVPIKDYDETQKYKDYHRYDTVTYPTPHTEKIREEVEDGFLTGLFQNPNGKLWDRQNSQRQYISQPVGSVPSESVEFAQWLYGNQDGALCKQGSIWMRYGVDVENNCNGFNVSTPTNFSRKNTT